MVCLKGNKPLNKLISKRLHYDKLQKSIKTNKSSWYLRGYGCSGGGYAYYIFDQDYILRGIWWIKW